MFIDVEVEQKELMEGHRSRQVLYAMQGSLGKTALENIIVNFLNGKDLHAIDR